MEFSWSANTQDKGEGVGERGCWCLHFPVGKPCLYVHTNPHTQTQFLTQYSRALIRHYLPSPQSSGFPLTWCEHCQASQGLHLAQCISGKAAVGAFITRTHCLDLQPARHLKPLGSPPKLEPEEESSGSFNGGSGLPEVSLCSLPLPAQRCGGHPLAAGCPSRPSSTQRRP